MSSMQILTIAAVWGVVTVGQHLYWLASFEPGEALTMQAMTAMIMHFFADAIIMASIVIAGAIRRIYENDKAAS